MDGHGDIITESVVIQHVDSEEECNVDEPPLERDSVLLQE